MTSFSKKMKMTNGLTVIYEKNAAADVVSLQIGVKVGSLNEADDESGICHLIEHMVFKGTKSYKAGEIAMLVEAGGGELNAYTSFDQTVYYVNVPTSSFELGLNILKEMAFDAAFDQEELAREKEVVVEEISRGKDSPQRVLGELLFRSFYTRHPYRRPVIGTAELVRGFSREKIVSFYKKWYRPQNVILAVCGNVDEARLSEQLEKLFRFEIPSPEVFHEIESEPERTGSTVTTQAMDIQATYFDIVFHAPQASHEDVPALDILSQLLGESDTSLLEQNTKEKEQLVHSIYSNCYTPKHPGVFVIGGLVDPRKLNDALASVRRQIDTAREQPFDGAKLERVKVLAQAQIIFDKETCEGTARKWMTYETVMGDYAYDEKYLERILALTPADIQKVARTYLNPSKAVIAVLHPLKERIKVDTSFFGEMPRKKTPKRYDKIASCRDVSVYRLPNGVRAVLKKNRRLPLVAVRATCLGGLRSEDDRNNGISSLISHVLVKGTKSLSQLQLAEKCESLAAHLGGYSGRNSWGGSISFLREKWREALPLFAEVLLDPAFDDAEVSKETRLQLEAIKNQEDNPSHIAFQIALKNLFRGHPYRLPTLGNKKSVGSFTPAKLRDFHANHLNAKDFVVAVAGDFDDAEMLEALDSEFSKLGAAKAKAAAKLKAPKKPDRVLKTFIEKNKKQAHLVVGFLGTSIYDQDRYVMDVINSVLSGQGGRLFLELRDKQSLAYTVSASTVEGLETGYFGAYIGTDPTKVKQALDGIFLELAKLVDKKVPSDELDRAKNYIVGNHEIDHQKNGSVAMQLALNELYGVGMKEYFDFVKKVKRVTSADVQRVAKKVFDFDRCVISLVGPKEAKVF